MAYYFIYIYIYIFPKHVLCRSNKLAAISHTTSQLTLSEYYIIYFIQLEKLYKISNPLNM